MYCTHKHHHIWKRERKLGDAWLKPTTSEGERTLLSMDGGYRLVVHRDRQPSIHKRQDIHSWENIPATESSFYIDTGLKNTCCHCNKPREKVSRGGRAKPKGYVCNDELGTCCRRTTIYNDSWLNMGWRRNICVCINKNKKKEKRRNWSPYHHPSFLPLVRKVITPLSATPRAFSSSDQYSPLLYSLRLLSSPFHSEHSTHENTWKIQFVLSLNKQIGI